ncbi:hypothetical protein ABIF29_007262 [Bradyrhizobium elkanii]|uniref:Crocagin biosynthetic protein CgnE/B domain-containing protein n=1 Tax=Bradyrhizobium elkanii TaxID=29448 RepID=A0ABV4FC71_BRAEL
MFDAKAWEGVNSLVDNYAQARPDDLFIVAYTADSRDSAAWVLACLNDRGIQTKLIPMSPFRDEGFHARLSNALPSPSELSGRLVILTFERDTMSHNDVIRTVIRTYDASRCVVIRAISASPTLFSHALNISPAELSARNAAILDRCTNATKLRIRTTGGTDLRVQLNNDRYRWISNRGVWRQGNFLMLPPGEVATYPAFIEGILVADFAFNANVITDKDARLENHPVTVHIEDGKAVKVECTDPETMMFLQQCFTMHCVNNVGELGFGTNVAIGAAIPLNSHINERRPGVHLGFGDHNQFSSAVSYTCSLHIDLIASGGLVWVDDESVPFDLDDLAPSSQPHPQNLLGEDLRSPIDDLEIDDCCGVLTRGRLELFPQ